MKVTNMEHYEMYCNSGRILCDNGENIPKEAEHNIRNGWSEEVRPTDYVLCHATDGNIFMDVYSYVYKNCSDFKEKTKYETAEIIRWKPLPYTFKLKEEDY